MQNDLSRLRRIRNIVTPLRGYTSSVSLSDCHLPLKGKAYLVRYRASDINWSL